jgi:hypothetical protein
LELVVQAARHQVVEKQTVMMAQILHSVQLQQRGVAKDTETAGKTILISLARVVVPRVATHLLLVEVVVTCVMEHLAEAMGLEAAVVGLTAMVLLVQQVGMA